MKPIPETTETKPQMSAAHERFVLGLADIDHDKGTPDRGEREVQL